MVHSFKRVTIGLVLLLGATSAQAQTTRIELCDDVCTLISASDHELIQPGQQHQVPKPAVDPAPRTKMHPRALVAAYGPGMAAP